MIFIFSILVNFNLIILTLLCNVTHLCKTNITTIIIYYIRYFEFVKIIKMTIFMIIICTFQFLLPSCSVKELLAFSPLGTLDLVV